MNYIPLLRKLLVIACLFCIGKSVSAQTIPPIDQLKPGESITITYSVTVNGGTPSGTVITNAGTVTGTNTNTANTNASTLTVVTCPQPTIVASGATTFCAGGSVTLTALAGDPNDAAQSYQWYLNGSAIAGTQTITATQNGNYTVQITNNCAGVITSTATSVTVNPLPTATITASQNPICFGGTSSLTFRTTGAGLVTVTYLVGATTSTVTVSGGIATVTASPVTTTTYSLVSATDANGCSQAINGAATVTVNPLPTAVIGGVTTVCSGSLVFLDFTVTGAGIVTVTYNLSPGGSTATKTFATAGTYPGTVVNTPITPGSYTYTIVSVTDANGCTNVGSGTGNLTVNALPMATIAGTTSVCFNSASPKVTFTGTAGAPPYTFTYKINGGTVTTVTSGGNTTATVNVPTNVAGTFTYTLISVSDGNGCSQAQSGTVTITVNPLLVGTITGTTSVCLNSAPFVVVTAAATGGVPPYTFSFLNNGVPYSNTSPSTVTFFVPTSTAGTFTYTLISVTDAAGCITVTNSTVTVTVNPLPTAIFGGTLSQTICQGTTATVTVNLTGSGNYTVTYLQTKGGISTPTTVNVTGNTLTITTSPSLSAGTYSYTVQSITDGNGCTNSGTGSATVIVKTCVSASITGTDQTICNGATASLTFAVTGNGTVTVTYKDVQGNVFTATGMQAGSPFTALTGPLSAGTHTFTVVSAQDQNASVNGGTGSATVIVDNPFTLAAAAAQNPILCYGGTTTLTVTPTGGVGTVSYTIVGPGGTATKTVAAPSAAVFQNVAAGTYTITAINGNPEACVATTTIVITQLQQVDAIVQAFEVTCKGAANGKVYITGITGGTPPYQASIDGINYVPITGSPLTPAFSGLAPSTFNIYLKDANGCMRVLAFITITEPPALSVTVTASTMNCGGNTNTLTVNVTGGTPGMTTQGGTGSYTYQMDGGAQQFSNVFVAGIGNHTITVSDAAGCVTTTIASVTGGPVVINYTQAVSSTCFNGQTGQIGVSATGGAGDVNYVLTKAGGSTSTLSGAQGAVVTFTGLGAGTYTITATAGCATTVTMNVTQPAQVKPPGTTNGAPDLLLNVVLSGSSFPTTASCITATYTVSVKTLGGANTAAQGVIVRVTKLSDVYTITLDPSSSATTWTEIANTNGYKEFQLKPGVELSCSGVGIPLVIRQCRNGDASKSTGALIVGSVRMQGGPQDTNSFDNVRASVFQLQ